MQVSEIMSRRVQIANPDWTVTQIARIMAEKDIGFMPVGENNRLVGTITDRDLVVRALASGRAGDTPLRDVMTREVEYCFDDEEADGVARNMGAVQVRRLPVVDRNKHLIGVFSLADAARAGSTATGSGLKGIVQPGGVHSQVGAHTQV